MSSTLGIVRSRSRSWRDFENFLHLPQYKMSSHISQLWHKLGTDDYPLVLGCDEHVSSSCLRSLVVRALER